jgi:hypothetical protein
LQPARRWLGQLWDFLVGRQDKGRETALVPDGCRMDIYGEPPPVPAVNRLRGGALIASMGLSSDRPDEDIDRLLRLVDQSLGISLPEILLTQTRQIRDAFSIDTPTRTLRALIWLINPQVFTIWRHGAVLLQRLLHRWSSDLNARELMPIVYIQEPSSPAGKALISVLGEIGFDTRGPEAAGGEVIFAIDRPDGVVVTALTGAHYEASRVAHAWHAELSRNRHLAQLNGNHSMLERLDSEQRDFLELRLAPVRDQGPRAVQWAPRLRELSSQAAEVGCEKGCRGLLEHVIQREAHLVILVDARTRKAAFSKGPDGPVLDVFPDLLSAQLMLRDKPTTAITAFGDLAGRDLLLWLAKERAGVSLWLESTDNLPRYLYISPDRVRAICAASI